VKGHTGRRLLFPRHPPKILLCDGQEFLKLAHPVLPGVAGCVRGAGALKQPHGFFVVRLGHIQGVFQGGFVLKRRFFFHGTSVVPIPG
jgi:hypothetical protein